MHAIIETGGRQYRVASGDVIRVEKLAGDVGSLRGTTQNLAAAVGTAVAGALLVGVAAAKAYSLSLGIPLYGVNHLAAHVAVDVLEHGPLPEPSIAVDGLSERSAS